MKRHKSEAFAHDAKSRVGLSSLFNVGYGLGAPLLSGILLVLIQPPVSLFPLAFFALIPLLGSVTKENLRSSFVCGYVTGVISYLGLIYWVIIAMNRYGGINIPLSCLILLLFVAYLSLYTGLFSLSCAYVEKRFALPVYITAPIIWVLLEYVRSFFLSGFPWSFIAHSQYNFRAFIQIASVTGTYFISFLVVAVNAVFFELMRRKRISIVYIAVVSILFGATLVYGFLSLSEKQDLPRLTTAIVQGNIRQDVKWDEAFKIRTIKKYAQMTAGADRGTDLIVWPETAMPFVFDREIYANKYIRSVSQAMNTNLLFGTMSQDKAGRYRNSSYILGRTGDTMGSYDKVHLVPFGEYTPLTSYLPFFEKLTAQGGDFVSGTGHVPIRTAIGDIGILICYEGVFPSITNETVRAGAQVLVNLTNDAWYDRTSAPFQHFSFYIFRAIETDRYVLRAANTGISAIIGPKGQVETKTSIFTEDVLKGSFAMKTSRTIYVRYGDYFVVLILLALAVAVFTRWRKGSYRR